MSYFKFSFPQPVIRRISLHHACSSKRGPDSAMPKNLKATAEPAARKGSDPRAGSVLETCLPITVRKNGELAIPLQVKPGSKVNCITDMTVDCVSLQISAPPVDGEANLEILKFFSKILGVKKENLELKGGKSRQKMLLISPNPSGPTQEQLYQTLKNKIKEAPGEH